MRRKRRIQPFGTGARWRLQIGRIWAEVWLAERFDDGREVWRWESNSAPGVGLPSFGWGPTRKSVTDEARQCFQSYGRPWPTARGRRFQRIPDKEVPHANP